MRPDEMASASGRGSSFASTPSVSRICSARRPRSVLLEHVDDRLDHARDVARGAATETATTTTALRRCCGRALARVRARTARTATGHATTSDIGELVDRGAAKSLEDAGCEFRSEALNRVSKAAHGEANTAIQIQVAINFQIAKCVMPLDSAVSFEGVALRPRSGTLVRRRLSLVQIPFSPRMHRTHHGRRCRRGLQQQHGKRWREQPPRAHRGGGRHVDHADRGRRACRVLREPHARRRRARHLRSVRKVEVLLPGARVHQERRLHRAPGVHRSLCAGRLRCASAPARRRTRTAPPCSRRSAPAPSPAARRSAPHRRPMPATPSPTAACRQVGLRPSSTGASPLTLRVSLPIAPPARRDSPAANGAAAAPISHLRCARLGASTRQASRGRATS